MQAGSRHCKERLLCGVKPQVKVVCGVKPQAKGVSGMQKLAKRGSTRFCAILGYKVQRLC